MTKARILIAEDEAIVARDLELLLGELGYDPVETVAAGEDAIRACATLRPDLVLMDINLATGMDGIDTALAIRSEFAIPTVFLTAYAADEIVERAKTARPLGYLVKPFDDRELRTTIEIALNQDRADRRLREADERLRLAEAVVTSSPAVMFRWRPTEGWPVAYVSPNVERVLGYAADALVSGRIPFDVLIHPDDRARVAREVADQTAAGACEFTQEYRLVSPDGTVCWVRDQTSVARDAAESVLYYEGVIQDITAQRQAEASLRLQSAALTAVSNAIVITDRAGVIEWVNPAFSVLTGYTAEEAIGRNPRDLLKSGVHDEAFYADMWQTLTAGAVWEGEITNRRKDGSLYVEYQEITPVTDGPGRISHFVGIKRDLTEQILLQQQLIQAQKLEVVGRLAGGIAHDFNNLLTVINGTADFILEDLPEGDPIRNELQPIREAGRRAAQITRQLLAFSRKQVVVPVRLDLPAQLDGMRAILRRLMGEDVSVVVETDDRVAPVLLDPTQLEQVILNLAVNARDAMPDGGTLRLSVSMVSLDATRAERLQECPPGPYVRLSVMDSGRGMTQEVLSRIFEPFFTTKGQGKGTGLGLSTVYGIIRQAGGGIEVTSEPGRGTAFDVHLPVAPADALVDAPDSAAPPARGSGTILVAE
ncbi:MAG: PAS domain S-box protein, partial [Vicinamibacterales bacterium]